MRERSVVCTFKLKKKVVCQFGSFGFSLAFPPHATKQRGGDKYVHGYYYDWSIHSARYLAVAMNNLVTIFFINERYTPQEKRARGFSITSCP
jgi:hypothetical protein